VTGEARRTVPVQREDARIEREPITDENIDAAMAGLDISTGEHDVELHEECRW
jgi:stress response protein YsnF